MLQARRSFLDKGYFDFVRAALVDAALEALSHPSFSGRPAAILDVGCGEGYYLEGLSRCLTLDSSVSVPAPITCFGMDVSKDALRMAARKHKDCFFFLANVHHEIPLLDRSVALLTGACAPRNFFEFRRVLTRAGRCLIVIPTPRHLYELRRHFDLLEIQSDKDQKIIEQAGGFRIVDSIIVESVVDLPAVDIEAVLTMTPNFWHKKEAREGLQKLTTTFSFRILSCEVFANEA